jgi:hypothetical protein
VIASLRAPRHDGAVLALPPLEEVGDLLARNRALRSTLDRQPIATLADLAQIRRLARQELLAAARHYLANRGEPLPASQADDNAPLLLAGHQPELFHPGVWIKNFALAGLAQRHRALAVNLIVDNDTVKTTRLPLPLPPVESPRLGTLAFDHWQGEETWETRSVHDATLFAHFADQVCERLAAWNSQPLIAEFWPEVLRQLGHDGKMGAAFAAARRHLERAWGCHNLEVPISVLCQTDSFAWLVGVLLSHLPRFVAVYNAVVQEYRRAHGIRSRRHPVPDLASQGDWLEAPLWCWHRDTNRRQRLFARLAADRLQLRCGDEVWPDLPTPARGTAFLSAFRQLTDTGRLIRTRALTTTLFARLLLGDLFLHGLGGGKYDELTDAIVRRFWGIELPGYVVVSATCWLGLPLPEVSAESYQRTRQLLRDLYHNPQRHLDLSARTRLATVLDEWHAWIGQQPSDRVGRRARFRALQRLDEQLRTGVASQREEVARQLRVMEANLSARAVLTRRDYPFPLYSAARLQPFLTSILTRIS